MLENTPSPPDLPPCPCCGSAVENALSRAPWPLYICPDAGCPISKCWLTEEALRALPRVVDGAEKLVEAYHDATVAHLRKERNAEQVAQVYSRDSHAFDMACGDVDAACESKRETCAAVLSAMVVKPTTQGAVEEKTGGETIETYYERQISWSAETFGPGERTLGLLDHIRKELKEIEAKPSDLSEYIDVAILAMDGFWRHGGKAQDLLPALLAKQKKNMARKWPDWRTVGEGKAIEHDRTGEASTVSLFDRRENASRCDCKSPVRAECQHTVRDLEDVYPCHCACHRNAVAKSSPAPVVPPPALDVDALLLMIKAKDLEIANLRRSINDAYQQHQCLAVGRNAGHCHVCAELEDIAMGRSHPSPSHPVPPAPEDADADKLIQDLVSAAIGTHIGDPVAQNNAGIPTLVDARAALRARIQPAQPAVTAEALWRVLPALNSQGCVTISDLAAALESLRKGAK